MTNKPFPPFGSILNQLRAAAVQIEYALYVFCGIDALPEARILNGRGLHALALPQYKSASDYHWPVQDLSIVLWDTGETDSSYLKATALTLLREGARQVCLYRNDLPSVEIYNR